MATVDEHLLPTYEKLKKIRERKDLKSRKPAYLRDKLILANGTEVDFNLRYYQVQGVLHLVAMNRFLLGDDTGLGKTAQSIASLCFVWEKKPETKVIILTNKSAVEQWVGEFEKFTTGITAFSCKGTPKKRAKARERFFNTEGPVAMVMGYRSAIGDFEHYQDLRDHIMVFDEATAFKNPSTQCHQVCAHLSKNASRSWALTATLIKNNLIEGWGIYKVIVPNLFGNKNNFLNHYCITRMQSLPGSRRQIPVIVGYRPKDIREFREKIDPYFLGRPKFEVASELPPLTKRVIKCGMSRIQQEKYKEALTGILGVGRGDEAEEKEVTKLTAVTYCQVIVNHPELIDVDGKSEKLDTLVELLNEGDFAGEKVIVFSRFRRMVDIIEKTLEKKKIKTCRITGAESEDGRAKSQKLFQNVDSGVDVILITSAAAEAVNLQAARAIVFYDTPWSAGDYLQLLGRMIRIGSTQDRCFAIHLVCRSTIDVRVMQVLNTKMGLVESVLGKRIKGDEDNGSAKQGELIETSSELNDLFDALTEDALK